MPTHYDDSVDQAQPDNNLHTANSTTTDLGQNTLSCLEVSVDYGVSQISLSIVHKPPMEHPIMTTRTRSASFSSSEHGSEALPTRENLSDMGNSENFPGVPVATGVSNADSNYGEQAGSKNSDREKDFESENQKISQESPVSPNADDATEPLAMTLARHVIINDTRNKIIISPPSILPSSNQAQQTQSTTNPRHLSFFEAPEPSYGLHQTEDGVAVYLTDYVTLKFFSVEAEEIEDALEKLPIIAPKLRSLIEKAERELSHAVNCLMWDLSGKNLNKITESQEIEDETEERYVSLLGLQPY